MDDSISKMLNYTMLKRWRSLKNPIPSKVQIRKKNYFYLVSLEIINNRIFVFGSAQSFLYICTNKKIIKKINISEEGKFYFFNI